MNKRAESDLLRAAALEQSAFWMPFTANRQFKKAPRLLARAEGMYYWTPEGRQVLDGTAGLWCVNAGHCRPKIIEAVKRQVAEMDFAPTFQMGHPIAFEFAERLARIAPERFSRVFFTNSGSESADTALKIALAYHRARGESQRFRLIGRERGYHGVNFGGLSVGGIVSNRKMFGALLAGVDHIRHTHDLARNAFSVGQPVHGAELADDLERLCALHDPSTIAAVIVEPIAGSAGVFLPPKGYLQRLREICDKHGILLIFDEVITGFGRTGQPFAAQTFGVTPDLMTVAKGLTNGCVPMGGVFAKQAIHDVAIGCVADRHLDPIEGKSGALRIDVQPNYPGPVREILFPDLQAATVHDPDFEKRYRLARFDEPPELGLVDRNELLPLVRYVPGMAREYVGESPRACLCFLSHPHPP